MKKKEDLYSLVKKSVLSLSEPEKYNFSSISASFFSNKDKLKLSAEYRIKYPESSLKELSEIISLETGKTITKSGLNHRFRKIKDLSEKLKGNESEQIL